MVTVAVIAIIASVAVPSYFGSVRKARRADAINALSLAQQAQERYRANNATYGDSFTNVGSGIMAVASGATATFDSTGAHYTIDITANTQFGYTLLAYAKAGSSQTKDSGCQCLELAASASQVTYSAGGPGGTSNGTAAGCGTILSGPSANQCWRK